MLYPLLYQSVILCCSLCYSPLLYPVLYTFVIPYVIPLLYPVLYTSVILCGLLKLPYTDNVLLRLIETKLHITASKYCYILL